MTALIPNPWINESAQSLPPAASPATGVDFPSASVATNSVSPGEPCRSLPSGETEPSVTLVCAPGESTSCGSTTRPCQPGESFETIGTRAGSPLTEQGDPRPHDPFSETQYIPELFSVYAARRCKDLISPPLPKVERNIDSLMLNAVGAALNLHPRDLDSDPAPLFLRKPRPAFLRALFELGDAR